MKKRNAVKTLARPLSLLMLLIAPTLACDDGPPEPEPCNTEAVGNICTIVGNGENGYDRGADDLAIPALEARLSLPQDTLTASDGTLYILDWNNHRLRSVASDGMLKWVAGRGELGGSLDDPASGDFNHPTNMIFDDDEQTIIIAAWHNSMIRSIDLATGDVTDVAGTGGRAYFGDGADALQSTLDLPASVAWDPDGHLVVMDQANQVIRRIREDDGTIQLVAGQCILENTTPCEEDQEPVRCPDGPNGSVSGKWTCGAPEDSCVGGVAGACTPSYSGDEIPALEMRMSQPFGQSAAPAGRILFDDDGNLYFADTGNALIRMIDTDGIVHRVAGTAPVDGEVQRGYAGDDGPATEALLNLPVDLALGDDGTLYFTDVLNHCVRAIDPAGTISTVVGTCGEDGYAGDDGPATGALLLRPFGVEWHDGRLLVSDTGNNVIRAVRLE